MRIISLLPSATEIVCELGLGDHMVGVTHECDYPPFVQKLPKVTRTLIRHDASSRDIDALVRERLQTQRALYSLDLPRLAEDDRARMSDADDLVASFRAVLAHCVSLNESCFAARMAFCHRIDQIKGEFTLIPP